MSTSLPYPHFLKTRQPPLWFDSLLDREWYGGESGILHGICFETRRILDRAGDGVIVCRHREIGIEASVCFCSIYMYLYSGLIKYISDRLH